MADQEIITNTKYNETTEVKIHIRKNAKGGIVKTTTLNKNIKSIGNIRKMFQLHESAPGNEYGHLGRGIKDAWYKHLCKVEILSIIDDRNVIYAMQDVEAIYKDLCNPILNDIDFSYRMDNKHTNFSTTYTFEEFRQWWIEYIKKDIGTVIKMTISKEHISNIPELTIKSEWDKYKLHMGLMKNKELKLSMKNEIVGDKEFLDVSFLDNIGQNPENVEYSKDFIVWWNDEKKEWLVEEKSKNGSNYYKPHFSLRDNTKQHYLEKAKIKNQTKYQRATTNFEKAVELKMSTLKKDFQTRNSPPVKIY